MALLFTQPRVSVSSSKKCRSLEILKAFEILKLTIAVVYLDDCSSTLTGQLTASTDSNKNEKLAGKFSHENWSRGEISVLINRKI